MQKATDTASGQKLNFTLPVLAFILSIWVGCILVYSREILDLSWFQTNLLSATLLLASGFSGLINYSPKMRKSGNFALILLFAVISIVMIFLSHYLINLAGSLVLGFLAGLQLSDYFHSDNKNSVSLDIVSVTLALTAGAWICVFNPEIIADIVLIILGMVVYLFLSIRSGKNMALKDTLTEHLDFKGKGLLYILKVVAVSLVIVTEVIFVFWHLLLPINEGNVFIPFVLPVFLTLLTIFRLFIIKISNNSLLVIYIFAVLAMFALGMFYTLSPILFVLVFALSVAYLNPALIRVFHLYQIQNKIILFSLLIAGFYMIISGYLADEHLIKITDLKLPENVFALSLIQNIVKDLVILPALLVVIVGILFLYRRRFVNI